MGVGVYVGYPWSPTVELEVSVMSAVRSGRVSVGIRQAGKAAPSLYLLSLPAQAKGWSSMCNKIVQRVAALLKNVK